jgi:small redox-active disulfide protein 2
MKSIKVLGTGCKKCKSTIALIQQVAKEKQLDINLQKIENPALIMTYGVMSTPAVLIDEQLVHKGSVPDRKLIEQWLIEH